jgi:hypothetical protein
MSDIIQRMKEALKVAETELSMVVRNEGWLSSELALKKVRAALVEADTTDPVEGQEAHLRKMGIAT